MAQAAKLRRMTLASHARVTCESCEAFRQFVVLLFVVGSKAAAYVCLKLGVDVRGFFINGGLLHCSIRIYKALLIWCRLLHCSIDSLVTV